MAEALAVDLLSWNLHGPPFAPRRRERLAAVAAELERRAPSVALLQEVWFPGDADWLTARLSRTHDVADGAPRRWPLRTGGLLAFIRRDGPWSLAGRPRFERYTASAGRLRFWEGDGAVGKGVQILSLAHRRHGAGLIVLHTHVQAQYDTIRHEQPRRRQLQQLAAVASAVDPALPVLAAGALNTGPEERLYADHLLPAWHDLTADVRAARPSAQTQFDCGAEPLWIDYVLALRGSAWRADVALELVENAARDDPYSDHNGLHARIVLHSM